jgi:hypothetical protein
MLAAVVLVITPWTGQSLPTAAAQAARFRLAVHGASTQTVTLSAQDVPQGWIASFCTRTLCSPMRYVLRLNGSGEGVVEFQAVRIDSSASRTAHIVIRAPDARTVSVTARA